MTSYLPGLVCGLEHSCVYRLSDGSRAIIWLVVVGDLQRIDSMDVSWKALSALSWSLYLNEKTVEIPVGFRGLWLYWDRWECPMCLLGAYGVGIAWWAFQLTMEVNWN